MPEDQPDERRKPHYKIHIDKQHFETKDPTPTGRELLTLAGKLPVEQYAIYEKQPGGPPKRIGLDERVDLRNPGVERFVTLPLDQTEGRTMRRQFALPADDVDWLGGTGLPYELVSEGGVLRVIIHDFPVPSGFSIERVTINVRIEPGYPDTQIDMAYFFPPLVRRDGRAIAATCQDSFDGKVWQRWSRHRTAANPWRPGVDNLATHFALIESWLTRELRKT